MVGRLAWVQLSVDGATVPDRPDARSNMLLECRETTESAGQPTVGIVASGSDDAERMLWRRRHEDRC